MHWPAISGSRTRRVDIESGVLPHCVRSDVTGGPDKAAGQLSLHGEVIGLDIAALIRAAGQASGRS